MILKFILLMTLSFNSIYAQNFEIKYLSCTLVSKKEGNSQWKTISPRLAKTQNSVDVSAIVKETELYFIYTDYIYLETKNNLDIYGTSRTKIYFDKTKNNILLSNTIYIDSSQINLESYVCKKREPTFKEKAKELKSKWFD